MKLEPINKRIIVSISFSNYLKEKSGVPKVVMSHSKMYQENNVSYISLFSVKKTIINDYTFLFCKYGIIIDGKYIGIYQMSSIINYLVTLIDSGYTMVGIHIHHLIYNNLKRIKEFLDTFYDIPIFYFIHDYFSCCTNYNLMKNGKSFCGGEGLILNNCKDCNSYSLTKKYTCKIKDLFSHYRDRILFIAPSEVAKKIFLNFYPKYSKSIIVISHQKYNGKYKENLGKIDMTKRLKLGFLAMPNNHKGWNVFKKMAEHYSNYDFYVFNSSEETYTNMIKRKVAFSENDGNAMVSALRKEGIDIAILWSLCAETYSFTYNEAYASNCFVLTNELSGNIRDSVYKNKNGIVLKNETELFKLLDDEKELKEMICKYKNTTEGGPLELLDNNEIITLTKNAENKIKGKTEYKRMFKFNNKPLLLLLNLLCN